VKGMGILRDRARSTPRWARDGGNGSVASVQDMDDQRKLTYRLYQAAMEMGEDDQLSLIIWLLLDRRSVVETEKEKYQEKIKGL